MNIIDGLGNEAYQIIQLVLSDGSVAVLELKYRPMTQRWNLDVVHDTFPAGAVRGIGLSAHPNLLRQWRNVIPFGLACVTNTGVDPFSIEDFATQRAVLYLLQGADVRTIETDVFGAAA